MISALVMWRRLRRTIEYALREEDFANIVGAGVFLILTGTLAYALALIGIGILVEIARRLGVAFIEIRSQEKAAKAGAERS